MVDTLSESWRNTIIQILNISSNNYCRYNISDLDSQIFIFQSSALPVLIYNIIYLMYALISDIIVILLDWRRNNVSTTSLKSRGELSGRIGTWKTSTCLWIYFTLSFRRRNLIKPNPMQLHPLCVYDALLGRKWFQTMIMWTYSNNKTYRRRMSLSSVFFVAHLCWTK